jgi:uncharacterized membrane protein
MVKKYLLKTLTYRLFASGITVLISILIGAPVELAYLLGVVELVAKPTIYFVHELIWDKVSNKKVLDPIEPKIILNEMIKEEVPKEIPKQIKRLSYISNRK